MTKLPSRVVLLRALESLVALDPERLAQLLPHADDQRGLVLEHAPVIDIALGRGEAVSPAADDDFQEPAHYGRAACRALALAAALKAARVWGVRSAMSRAP